MSDALDAQIGPVKGNPLYKGLAKFFSGLDSYARDPNNILAQGLPLPEGAGVGITSGWATLMGLPEAARFWNDRHGGFPLTEGKNQTLKLAPDVLEGGLASLPFVSGPTNAARKTALKVADKALDLSKGLPKGQLNALYGGKAGQPAPKDPDIFLSHGTSAGKLRVDKSKGGSSEPDLPQELYNISMALTRGKLSDFGGADTILVPQHGRFEPKLDQTIITATDSYSPRYGSALGYRADGGTKLDDFLRGFVSRDEFKEALQKQANRRLADQFVPIYPAGGIHQEGDKAVSKGLAAFRKFQEASQVPFTGGSARAKVISPYDFFQNRVAMSPHFQSLADYEMSPYGGQILGSQSGHSRLAAAEKAAYGLLDKLVYENSFGSLDSLGSFHNGKIESLKSLASGKLLPYDRSAKGRAFDSEREAFDFSKLRYSDGNGNYLPMTPEQIREVRQTAGKILQQMKTAPSDYGELKRFGQTKVNPDTFAGIITSSGADWLPKAALKRGLAFERLPYGSSASEAVGIANDMQRAGKNPSILTRGLAGRESTRQAAADDALLSQLNAPSSPTTAIPDFPKKPPPDFTKKTFAELMAEDTASMSPEVWSAWDAQQKHLKEQFLQTDWGSMTPEYLTKLKASAAFTHFPFGAKAKINEALGIAPGKTFSLLNHPPVTKPGLENMIGLASGDIPWHAKKPDSWNFAHEFKKDFPGLTDEQAKALQDISFWAHMKKSSGDASLASLWEKDIDGAIKKLLAGL